MKLKLNQAGAMTVAKGIGLAVAVVVALALLPTIFVSISAGENATNTTANSAVHNLIPLIGIMFVIGVLVLVVVWVIRESGQ